MKHDTQKKQKRRGKKKKGGGKKEEIGGGRVACQLGEKEKVRFSPAPQVPLWRVKKTGGEKKREVWRKKDWGPARHCPCITSWETGKKKGTNSRPIQGKIIGKRLRGTKESKKRPLLAAEL